MKVYKVILESKDSNEELCQSEIFVLAASICNALKKLDLSNKVIYDEVKGIAEACSITEL